MATRDGSDDVDSGGTLRDILADLASAQGDPSNPPGPSGLPALPEPTWVLPPYTPRSLTTSGTERAPPSPMPRTSSAQRILQQRTISISQVTAVPAVEAGLQPTFFDPPSRSIFSSGPPTASVSVNTAQASLSSAVPSSSSRPLASLSVTGGPSNRRLMSGMSEIPRPSTSSALPSRRGPLPVPEKDIDDPSTTVTSDADLIPQYTSTTLSRLFAGTDGHASLLSRAPSRLRTMSGMARSWEDAATLNGHLLHRGFIAGRHSDIRVHAFGKSYDLHKLLLDRVPFFSSAFSGSWAESSSREMTLHPEEIDSNITKSAFELALRRIYGAHSPVEEDQEAIGLFATGCWLDMTDLVDSSVDSLLRQMHPSKLDVLIKLVTGSYYGKAGDRILSSAKAMLCREGWEMPYGYWDGIPAEIIREIIAGDPFYVPGEWERWFITLKLLNRRLKAKAAEAGLISPTGRYLQPRPTSLKFFAVRFDGTYRRDAGLAGRHISERDEAWVALYTAPEITPLLVLLDEGIHYVHLRFEQLQQIRTQKDILGVPVLPEKIISNALWRSMELRQRVVNAHETDLELGLSEEAEGYMEEEEEEEGEEGVRSPIVSEKGKRPELPMRQQSEMESGSWDGNGKPRKFWIPGTDSSSVMGGGREACLAANSTGGADWTPHMSRLSATLEPSDVAWASDITAIGGEHGRPHSRAGNDVQPARFSHYPPFRFSAEFPNPRTLKEKKRVYSQTVWYAGSMWNLYIQRVNTSKNQQLGIYLHRAKDRDPSDDPLAQFIPATVDDRIGQLERDIILRKNERRSRQWRGEVIASGVEADPEDETSASGGELENAEPEASSTRTPGMSSLLKKTEGSTKMHKTSQTPINNSGPLTSTLPRHQRYSTSHIPDSDEENEELVRTSRRFNVSALPAYVDGRPTIKTYFKIYSPSKAGRMLSIYESAPDRFNFSQSWGWKSSQMVLDDGIGDHDVSKGAKDGKLRYMVVIGNV